MVICRQIRRPDNTANIIMGLAQGPSRYGGAPTDYARQVFVVGLKVDPWRPDVAGRCESEDKSSLDLFKIRIRHCCGKEVFKAFDAPLTLFRDLLFRSQRSRIMGSLSFLRAREKLGKA